ncbi:tetratricopeptide repeat protein [bacterium]|nr:tetratricopeptide repeat protein [bacterium]
MKNRTALFIVLIFISLFSLAFSPFEKEAKESVEGRKKYAVGEMSEAENEFAEAAKRLENNAEAYYDLGNALQSQQKYEDALNAYKKSLETGKTTENLRSKIFHNMGNSFAGLGKYQDAEKFYMKSLEEEPSRESAENLEIVRRIIAQQKEQQEQEQHNKENQEKQEQKEEEKQNEDPDDEQKNKQDQQSAEQNDENNEQNDEENSSGNDDEGETQDEENKSAAAEEQDDEQNSDDKAKESSVLKQFKQRKNLQISPFMLKKEQKSGGDQTW